MKHACVIAVIGAICSSVSPAIANNLTGNQLYDLCTANAPDAVGICVGYHVAIVEGLAYGASSVWAITGQTSVEEMNAMIGVSLGYCIPDEAVVEQIRDINIAFLTANPAIRHESARYLFTQSMAEAFPCVE